VKVGIDLGGTKIEAIVLDGVGKEVWRRRVRTPHADYTATLEAIASLVMLAQQQAGVPLSASVGIGTPGSLYSMKGSPVPVMKNCNSTVLNGMPLKRDLETLLGCAVYMANDANCFALAETLSGQGVDMFDEGIPETVFGVILGTGVGAGIIVRGQPLIGLHGIAGEWGHNPLPESALALLPVTEKGRACYCGRNDCVETYLSGPGLALSYQLRFGDVRSSKAILRGVRSRDEASLSIWRMYSEQLACSLSYIVNILDPRLIVLGGGMSTIPEIYEGLAQRMEPYIFSGQFETPVVPAKLGDSAGVFGAAWLNPE